MMRYDDADADTAGEAGDADTDADAGDVGDADASEAGDAGDADARTTRYMIPHQPYPALNALLI